MTVIQKYLVEIIRVCPFFVCRLNFVQERVGLFYGRHLKIVCKGVEQFIVLVGRQKADLVICRLVKQIGTATRDDARERRVASAGIELVSIKEARIEAALYRKSMSGSEAVAAGTRRSLLGDEIVGRINQLGTISETPEHLARVFLSPEHRIAAEIGRAHV